MKTKDVFILFSFIFLAFIFRFHTFFQSVIDQDETVYLLGANSLLNGENLYTEVWENKPPGIFILFAIALFILGDGVVSIRFFACLAIGIAAFCLYKIGKSLFKEEEIGLFAGLLYSIVTLTNGGLAANTEIFFNVFTAIGFLLLFDAIYKNKNPNRYKHVILVTGVFLGIGIQIKQVVLFDFIAILIIVAIHNLYKKIEKFVLEDFLWRIFSWYLWLIIGLFIPAIITFISFYSFSDFSAYLEVNYTATLTRISYESLSLKTLVYALIQQGITNSILWLTVLLTPVYFFLERKENFAKQLPVIDLTTWSLMSFLGICAIKSFFSHYFIQLQLPLCLLTSYVLISLLRKISFLPKLIKALILLALLIPTLIKSIYPSFQSSLNYIIFRYVYNQPYWGDNPAVIANYLKDKIKDDDYIYVFDYQIVIYYLTKAKIPTKYVHVSLLIKDRAKVAGIEPNEEIDNIMAKKPAYVIKTRKGNYSTTKNLNNHLRQNYILDKSFKLTDGSNNIVDIYRLKSGQLAFK